MHLEKFNEEVYKYIENIVNRTKSINSYKGKIPAIEIDLVLDDIRKLYDCFLLMRSLTGSDHEKLHTWDGSSGQEAPVPVEKELHKEKGDDVLEKDKDLEEEKATKAKKSSKDSAVEVPEGKTEKPVDKPSNNIQDKSPDKGKDKSSEIDKAILADKLKRDDPPSINEIIATKRSGSSISSRMQSNPISNLKSAIGINEKFIFVYELFGGNTQLYNQTIEQLNNMPGKNEAISLLESLRSEHQWDIENMAFQKLVDMVNRRYS